MLHRKATQDGFADTADFAEIPTAELECLLAASCKVFDVPMAALSLIASSPIWAGSVEGLDGPAVIASCAAVLHVPAPVIISNASGDDRIQGVRSAQGGFAVRFYAGSPLTLGGRYAGTLSLIGARPRRMSAQEKRTLSGMAGLAEAVLEKVRVRHLEEALAAQTRLAQHHHDSERRYRKMYERSSALARIGTWECDLATETLTWTDGVYDIFDLPRGSPITRRQILDMYFDDSREEMDQRRSQAIAECSGFTMDIHIKTLKGNEKWVRLSVDVEAEEGRPVRIFGTKQDVTQERALTDRLRELAERDPLTGLANRGLFEERLGQACRGPEDEGRTALFLVDLDGFKAINDTYGHVAGDACLKAIAGRLREAFGEGVFIARIGGDEFAVLVEADVAPPVMEARAQHILAEVQKPITWERHVFEVGASVGIAVTEGAEGRSRLFPEADSAMYAAKKAGRNTYRIFQR